MADQTHIWRVLLVDDDPDDQLLTRNMLTQNHRRRYILDCASTYEQGLSALQDGPYDAILVDYGLGARSGISFIREAIASGCHAPMLMLTGHGSYEIDLAGMQAGAADYLNKNELTPALLERSLRFAIEQQRLIEDNRRQRDLLERMMQDSLVAFAVLRGPQHRYILANPAYQALVGQQELEERTLAESWPEIADQVIPLLDAVFASGQSNKVIDMPFTSAQANPAYYAFTFAPLFDASGQVEGVVLTAEDTTQAVLNRQALLAWEGTLSSFFEAEAILSGIIELRADDIAYISTNRMLANFYGQTPEEIGGKTARDLQVDETDIAGWVEQYRRCLATQGPVSYEYPFTYRQREGWYFATISQIHNAASRLPRFAFVAVDLTLHKLRELRLAEALTETETETNRLRAVMQALPVGVMLVDQNGGAILANQDYERIWGSQRPDVNSVEDYEPFQAWWMEGGQPLKPHEWASARALQLGEPVLGQYLRIQRFDGSIGYVLNSAAPVFDSQHRVIGACIAIMDITERIEYSAQMEVQRRLIQQRELERMDIARDLHDGVLQEMTVIGFGLAEAMRIDDKTARLEKLQWVQQALQKQSSEIRTFCNELRPPALAPFGLEKAIRSHITEIQRRSPNLQVHLHLDADRQKLPETVRMALFRVYQEVLNNINHHAHANNVWINWNLDEQEARLEIRDDGVGYEVPRDWVVQARSGHLGLLGMRERVESIGGRITLDSHPGSGSKVTVQVACTSHQNAGA